MIFFFGLVGLGFMAVLREYLILVKVCVFSFFHLGLGFIQQLIMFLSILLDSRNEVHVAGIYGSFSVFDKSCLKPHYLCNFDKICRP